MMKEYAVLHIMAMTAGLLADLIIGDPHGLPHPVRAIGALITRLEHRLTGSMTGNVQPGAGRDPQQLRRKGALLWWIVVLATALVSLLVLGICYRVNRYAGAFAEAVLTCYLMAAGSLRRESMAVADALGRGRIGEARQSLSMIVGRDTKELCDGDIIRAAVETVAENTSDGVIAPLLYTAVGGPVLGWIYKAVNTMDSMIGYRNERYEHFGRTAARADDVWNYIPSRISALGMVAAAFIAGLFSGSYSGKNAFRIWRRDRRCHLSPNSAQTESVCAGALGLQLGGTHTYNGMPVAKPTIGDDLKDPETADVARANTLMFLTEGVVFACILAVWILIALLMRGRM